MHSLHFHVPGVPVAKGRPRTVVRGKFASHYTPKPTVQYENLVKAQAAQAMQGRPPMEGPCALTIIACFPWPKSTTKKRRAAVDGAWKDTKPDVDNVLKAVKDAMNGVVYRDDSQIATVTASKVLHDVPGLRVIVQSLEGQPCEVGHED